MTETIDPPVIVDETTADMFYQPTTVLTVYKSKFDKFYIEAAPVIEDKGAFTTGAARPLDEETIISLLGAMRTTERSLITTSASEFLPQNLLFTHQSASKQIIAWYTFPQQKIMRFTDSHEHKLKTGPRDIPGLVYIYVNDDLYVFAYKGKKRPLPTTVMFRAPFYNVYEEGRVCMGTVRKQGIRKSYYGDLMTAWETKLWNSFFTDEEYNKRATIDLKVLWKKFRQPFSEKVLVRQGKSLKSILESL